jgi:formyltetrahydrofolate deformylase
MITVGRAASKLGTLRVYGPDRAGIVATITQLLGRYGCNIVKSQQWTDRGASLFFQRLVFVYDHNHAEKASCQTDLNEIGKDLGLEVQLNWRDRRKKIGIMVSKFDHCLWEVLLRHSAHELDADIDVVVSNHEDLRHVADTFGVPFHVVPIAPEDKLKQEEKQLELLEDIDLVVLARYEPYFLRIHIM